MSAYFAVLLSISPLIGFSMYTQVNKWERNKKNIWHQTTDKHLRKKKSADMQTLTHTNTKRKNVIFNTVFQGTIWNNIKNIHCSWTDRQNPYMGLWETQDPGNTTLDTHLMEQRGSKQKLSIRDSKILVQNRRLLCNIHMYILVF